MDKGCIGEQVGTIHNEDPCKLFHELENQSDPVPEVLLSDKFVDVL